VDALGDDLRWSEAFPSLARTGQDRKLRRLLEEAEALHRSAAGRLRGLGWEDLARQAEQFAAWTRFDLDEPVMARRLYGVVRDLREIPQHGAFLARALEGALDLAGAELGNVQVLDRATGSLRIAVQHGFGAEFLDHFAVVDDDRSACGRAAKECAQTVIADVNADASFAPHRDAAAAAAFRAVQSTPLVDATGHLLGVVSTHYRYPYAPPARDLEILKRYGCLVGQMMTSHLSTPPPRRAGESPPGRRVEPGRRPASAGLRPFAERAG
jgi:hypothetical protein